MTKAKTKNAPSPAPEAPKGWALQVVGEPGKTPDQQMAEVATHGFVGNARTLVDFGAPTFGELSLTDCAQALKSTAQELNTGDLSAAVSMLAAQSVALNSMFGELARRASLNMGTHLDATDRYMRLALKAQGQCRATLETLAAIKNPPVVFARQANINNGGQQQVNNGSAAPKPGQPSHAPESAIEQSKLLEAPNGERLDFGTKSKASRAYPRMATLGAIKRPQDGSR